MGFVVSASSAAVIAAVAGAAIVATPIARTEVPVGGVAAATDVSLTAASRPLYPWPVLFPPNEDRRGGDGAAFEATAEDAAATADLIDQSFREFRTAVRNDFHEFGNRLGYLGKQLYVGFNFGESIVASLVFNGTDMLRGEGVLKNLGEIAYDVALAFVYIAVDELYLAVPGLPPIVVLPERPPLDPPPGWRAPLSPQPGRPLVVPFVENDAIGAGQTLVEDSSEPRNVSPAQQRKADATGDDPVTSPAGDQDTVDTDVSDPAVTDPDFSDPDMSDPDMSDPDISDPDVPGGTDEESTEAHEPAPAETRESAPDGAGDAGSDPTDE